MEPGKAPEISTQAVLSLQGELPEGVTEVIKGYDFNKGINYDDIFASYATMGIQATNLHRAIDQINKMVNKKLEPLAEKDMPAMPNPVGREYTNCTIFLSFTSNMISCGNRDIIRYLAEHNMVDVLVTSGGGIEEDIMKCLAPAYLGDFHKWKGTELRKRGINRIGNMLVPNRNYCMFEDWFVGLLDQLIDEQEEQKINWTPSKLIWRMGERINNPESVFYWCWKNRIPVFCPGITDGAIGDVIYFHSFRKPGFRLDIAEDVRLLNLQAAYAKNTGMIILGGGIIKHHVCNANLMRNGADFCVFINTASEFDCSDAGAEPDEAQSWGKIRPYAEAIKLNSDASLVFPIIVAQTFAKSVDRFKVLYNGDIKENEANGLEVVNNP